MSAPEQRKARTDKRRVSRTELALRALFNRVYGEYRGYAVCSFALEAFALYVLISGAFK